MTGDERLRQAVSNNAVWCDTVCCAHGCPGEFHDGLWINRHETPPFSPNVVTLSPVGAAADPLARIRELLDAGIPGSWAVKDSFAELELAPLGFQILFEATWLYWPVSRPAPVRAGAGAHWTTVRQAAELARWEAAWRGEPAGGGPAAPLFLPALLADRNVAVVAGYEQQRIVAGAIANRTGAVVGLSNLFVPEHDPEPFRAGCVAAVIGAFPGLPLVGYESGQELAVARSLGFEALGPLRVWLRVNRAE